MYACLVDAGLPAVLLDQDAGLAMVSWDDRLVAGAVLLTPASPEVLLFGDTSGIVVPPDFASTPALPYRLLLDGVDHSALYSDCVAASGYQAPREGPADSYADELTEKAALAQVTNEWASCARANGLSDVTDAAAPTVDSWTTVPVALLAPTTTVESLRSALAACPNYDFDRLAAAPNKYHDRDQPGWRPDPNIAVDANWDQLDQTETTHVEALYTVLFERLNQVSAAAGLPGNDGPERQPGT
jgi:hypothetical protein